MTHKICRLMAIMIFVIMSGVMVCSCDNDKDEELEADSIVGTWEYSDIESDEDEIASVKMTLTFNKDKTGSIVENWSYQTRASWSEEYRMEFGWSTSSDSNGNDILKISYISGDKDTEIFPGAANTVLWKVQYVQTGNILNVHVNGGVLVFKRK